MGRRRYNQPASIVIDISYIYEIVIDNVYRVTSKLEQRTGYNNEFLDLQNVITYNKSFLDNLVSSFVTYALGLWDNSDTVEILMVEFINDIEDNLVIHQVWTSQHGEKALDEMSDIIQRVFEHRVLGQFTDTLSDHLGNSPIQNFNIRSRRSNQSGYETYLTLHT